MLILLGYVFNTNVGKGKNKVAGIGVFSIKVAVKE